jgi:hypothetical protein
MTMTKTIGEIYGTKTLNGFVIEIAAITKTGRIKVAEYLNGRKTRTAVWTEETIDRLYPTRISAA